MPDLLKCLLPTCHFLWNHPLRSVLEAYLAIQDWKRPYYVRPQILPGGSFLAIQAPLSHCIDRNIRDQSLGHNHPRHKHGPVEEASVHCVQMRTDHTASPHGYAAPKKNGPVNLVPVEAIRIRASLWLVVVVVQHGGIVPMHAALYFQPVHRIGDPRFANTTDLGKKTKPGALFGSCTLVAQRPCR